MIIDDFDLTPLLHGARYRATRIGADAGFASRVYRLECEDQAGGALPARLIAKLSHQSSREVAFYRELAPRCGSLVPRCFAAWHDPATEKNILLFEELEGADPDGAADACTIDQARAAVDAFAALHAQWWQSPELETRSWLPPFGDFTDQLRKYQERASTFAARFADSLRPGTRRLLAAVRPDHAATLASLAQPPHTLLLVDAHIYNMAFTPERAVLFDWQKCATGRPAVDLSQFLITSLQTDDRATHESALIARYHAALVAGGVPDYPLEQLHHDLRLAFLRWWIGTVNGFGGTAAATWGARQTELAHIAVTRWADLATNYDLPGLLTRPG